MGIDSSLIRSKSAVNFAYMIFLKLRAEGAEAASIETYVRKWLVLSMLTGRYSGSPESSFDYDIKNISKDTVAEYLRQVEAAELSDAFWNVRLVQQLNTSTATSPSFYVYLAAQCRNGTKGFLSRDITIRNLIEHKGDIHHIFPKDYLKKLNVPRSMYNQVANYVCMQSEINVRIGNKAPGVYFGDLREQCEVGTPRYGSICDAEELRGNLAANDIPEEIHGMEVEDYGRFLDLRRAMMAARMRGYYEGL